MVPGARPVEMSYAVPVSVENLPADLKVDEVQPSFVNIVLVGPRRAFYLFDPNRVTVSVDASSADRGRSTFKISERNVKHPSDMIVQDLSPSTVRVSLKKTQADEIVPG
jgi:hypothetical protein